MKIKYQDFKFRADSLALIRICNQIITEYQDAGFVLTLRQLYYQLVSRDHIANKQTEYKRVGSIINDARLAGLIDWEALEDRTRNLKSLAHWNSPAEIMSAVASQYRIDKWAGQDMRPEVWIEKDALLGVIEGVCQRHDVGFFSCRGYTSQSEMWASALRFIERAKLGQSTKIIHLGDHDPSGQDMSRDIEDRINMFMARHGYAGQLKFVRIALNWNQIEEYNPPPNPAKSTDSRFAAYAAEHGDESWELDALDPQVIASLIKDEVLTDRDDGKWFVQRQRETTEKAQLQAVSDRWEEVVDFVEE